MDSQGTHQTRFERETGITKQGDGRYGAILDRSWWIVAGPNGGYVAAIILRAMVDTVDETTRRPRSLTVQYLRPPTEGEVTIDVVVERSGRTVSNLTARLTQNGKLIALAMAAFATDRESVVEFDETNGFDDVLGGARVPRADEIEVIAVDPERDVPMRQHYDLRWVLGNLPFTAEPDPDARALSGGWLRPAEQVAVDEVVLAAMSDAWMPPVFSRISVPLAVPTIDLTIHFRRPPVDPLAFCFVVFDSPVAVGGFTVEHGRIFSQEGALLAESRQLAVLA